MSSLTFDQAFKIAGALGAICTFIYTYWTWHDKSRKEFEAMRAQDQRSAETRRIEATKPFLDRQLDNYVFATRVVATLATSDDEATLKEAHISFWGLFYGELALVESPEVADAMAAIGRAIKPSPDKADLPPDGASMAEEKQALQQLALNLTKAIRKSLDKSWGIRAWSKPDQP